MLSLITAPLSFIFAVGAYARRFAYDQKLLPIAPTPLPTISVGGLEAGGSGKTPVTAFLLYYLLTKNYHPGLLSRGYGRKNHNLYIRQKNDPAHPDNLGDEPAMLIDLGLNIPMGIFPERKKAAQKLKSLCDVLVLDDGFSHRKFQRHLDIVVLRGEKPFGNGHLLPWGLLREPPSSLKRANIVWLHYRSPTLIDPPLQAPLIVQSYAKPSALKTLQGEIVQAKKPRVIAAAGIASPQDLKNSVIQTGAELLNFFPYPDHHRYTENDVQYLQKQARYAEGVIVTAKDAVKLKTLWKGDIPLWVLGTEVQIVLGEQELYSAITNVLEIP